MQDQNFIENEWRPARSGATDDIINPATRRVIGTAPASDVADVDDAVAAAGRAFPEWAAKTRERSEALHELARRIEGDIEHLSAIESENVGKPVSIMEFRRWTSRSTTGGSSRRRAASSRARPASTWPATSMLRREPLGVIGSIAPWNYPLNMATWKVRPRSPWGTPSCSSHRSSPYTALRLAELAADILPPVCSTWCAGGARRPASRSSPTQTWRWCRSPARSRPARRSPRLLRDPEARAPRARRQGAGRGVRRRRHRRPSRPVCALPATTTPDRTAPPPAG